MQLVWSELDCLFKSNLVLISDVMTSTYSTGVMNTPGNSKHHNYIFNFLQSLKPSDSQFMLQICESQDLSDVFV